MSRQTTLEEAIDRAMRKNACGGANDAEDAAVIATLVVKHWGDDAPRVIEQALELAREQVRRWAKKGGKAPPEPPDPEGGA